MNFLETEVNKKSYIKILCAFIILIVIILIIYYASLLIAKPLTLDEDAVIADIGEANMNVHIDKLVHEQGDNKAEIFGWAYKEGEQITTIYCNYALKNQETGEMYILKTRHEENLNVPEEYSNSGIHTRFLTFGIKKGRYDIYVFYRNNNSTLNKIFAKTGIHIDI